MTQSGFKLTLFLSDIGIAIMSMYIFNCYAWFY